MPFPLKVSNISHGLDLSWTIPCGNGLGRDRSHDQFTIGCHFATCQTRSAAKPHHEYNDDKLLSHSLWWIVSLVFDTALFWRNTGVDWICHGVSVVLGFCLFMYLYVLQPHSPWRGTTCLVPDLLWSGLSQGTDGRHSPCLVTGLLL